MRRIIFNVFAILYTIIAVSVTVFMLNYDNIHTYDFKDKQYIVIKNTDKVEIKDNALLVLDKLNDKSNIKGEMVYYYTSTTSKELAYGYIDDVIEESDGTRAINIGGVYYKEENVISKVADAKSYGIVGGILSVLTSKLGYLFIVVLPALVLFIFEIYLFSKYLKKKK